jgi:hypothetical protein
MPLPTAEEAARLVAEPRRPIMLRSARDGARNVTGSITPVDPEIAKSLLVRWPKLIGEMNEEDAGWRWEQILGVSHDIADPSPFVSDVGLERLAIVHEDQVHGILVTSLPERPPGLSQCFPLVFVEYVAVAPWNRPRSRARLFKAIGPTLLELAVLRSAAVRRSGCIGLHSGGMKATEFYLRLGMDYRGPDPEEETHADYFDGGASWVEDFMSAWVML